MEQDTARDDLRCEAALTLRASLKVELARTEKPVGLLYTIEERRRRENLTDELEEAEADIRRYC